MLDFCSRRKEDIVIEDGNLCEKGNTLAMPLLLKLDLIINILENVFSTHDYTNTFPWIV